MIERELESKKGVIKPEIKRIEELERWFKTEYLSRLHTIERYDYLGLICSDKRYALETEAYDKEQELRTLRNQEKLPDIRNKNLL